ncbi:GAF domain-containing protein [Burkholderia sp. WP9]|uniref:GAF domain-containing protein n=1 Tax=Burkholderia sp. WP9 TaxID=1500263 RepID=UPI000898A735|nr:GAF domain-containing protein [Burkholderia sp. WP9]SEF13975.1 GAF domain-containing protein [Burkholderia sp. WP9]
MSVDIGRQSGDNVTQADDLKFAIGALELRRACDPGQSPETMLDRILEILRAPVPFDIATFSEYAIEPTVTQTSKPVLVLGRYAVDDGKRFNWPARWLKVPSTMMEWIDGTELAVPDINAFFRENPSFRTLRNNPVTREYLNRGARSFVVAVLKENGGTVVSLTLARKRGEPFTSEDQRTLDKLLVSDTLRLVRAAYQAQAALFHQEIRDLFAQRAGPLEIAQSAVKRLCEHFRWDYAAIFRLAHARERFELVQQYNATDKKLLVREDYTQPIGAGVLGRVYKTGMPVRVENTQGRDKHGYIQLAPDAHSCLCYPILVDRSVEWILDFESSEEGAFQHPDVAVLAELIKEAQKTVALWFEMRLNKALIENVEQGVIVVDRANRITRLNSLANQLLGVLPDKESRISPIPAGVRGMSTGSVRGEDLSRFGADEEAKAILASGHVAEKPLRLRGADGLERHVVASSREAEDAFNRRIWRLTDPKGWDWVTALEYMRTTVQGVAQQTRGPLLLANALVAKARGLAEDNPDLQNLLSKARASLCKTDITYERLVDGLEVERTPVGNPVAVDVKAAIDRFVADLPLYDSNSIAVTQTDSVPAAYADPDRVRFVIHSTLGYMLAIRLPSSKVSVEVDGGRRHVSVKLSTSIRGAAGIAVLPADADRLTRARTDAQQATVHALSAVRRMIECNGGTLKASQRADTLTIAFTLPVPSVAKYRMREKGTSNA